MTGVSSDPAICYPNSFHNEWPTGEFVDFSGEKANVNSTKLLFHEYEQTAGASLQLARLIFVFLFSLVISSCKHICK